MSKNLVLGGGKTGKAAYVFLKNQSEDVVVWDDNPDVMASFGGDVFSSFEGITRVILSPGLPIMWPYTHPLYKEARLRQIPIISDIDLLYLHSPNSKYIGITGTNGKSTTTALLGHCLSFKKNVAIGGNLGTAALSLPIFEKDGIYVLEMSSYQLEASNLIEFDCAILLNITPDHLDRHGGMSGYVYAKEKIFKGMPENQQRYAVLGIDELHGREIDDYLSPLMKERLTLISNETLLINGYSLSGTSIYHDTDFLWDMAEHKFLKGTHNAQNIMAVWATLRRLGMKDDEIQEKIMSFKGLEHRQEYVMETDDGIVFINDSKATNAEATLQALKAYDCVHLILGGRPKEGGIEALIPYFNRIEHALLIGEAADEFAVVLSKYNVPFTVTKTLEETLLFGFKPESIILLSPACASFDQFNNFEERGNAFKRLVLERFKSSNKV